MGSEIVVVVDVDIVKEFKCKPNKKIASRRAVANPKTSIYLGPAQKRGAPAKKLPLRSRAWLQDPAALGQARPFLSPFLRPSSNTTTQR